MTISSSNLTSVFVIPAKAGIHPSICVELAVIVPAEKWIPAFAGMTEYASS